MKCLVTKLKESVDNEDLLRLGELALTFNKSDNDDVTKRFIGIAAKTDIELTIIGNAYFIDSTNENIGKTTKIIGNTGQAKFYVSNEPCKVVASNKYAIVTLQIGNPCITGDLSFLSGMDMLSTLTIANSSITGNLSFIRKYTPNLINLNIGTESITGDLSDLSNLVKINNLNIECSTIKGNLSALSTMAGLTDIKLKKAQVEGDVSALPKDVGFFSTQKGTTALSWKGERAESTKIMALESVRLGEDIDRMLINQAKCIAAPLGEDEWYKRIQVYGTRTSASDEAVQTLKSKGYTVIINNVIL